MPIIISKGICSDNDKAPKKIAQVVKLSRSSSREACLISNAAMNDVLNFKMVRIVKADGESTTSVLANINGTQTKKVAVLEQLTEKEYKASETATKKVEAAGPSIYARSMAFHRKYKCNSSGLKEKKEMLNQIRNSSVRTDMSRAKNTEFCNVSGRSRDEVVAWAVSHANKNESSLLDELFALEEEYIVFQRTQMATSDSDKEKIQSPKAFSNVDCSPLKMLLAAKENKHGRVSMPFLSAQKLVELRSTFENINQESNQQSSGLGAANMQNLFYKGNSSSPRQIVSPLKNSVKLSGTGTMTNSKRATSASGVASLSQRLDRMRNEKTEEFIHKVTRPVVAAKRAKLVAPSKGMLGATALPPTEEEPEAIDDESPKHKNIKNNGGTSRDVSPYRGRIVSMHPSNNVPDERERNGNSNTSKSVVRIVHDSDDDDGGGLGMKAKVKRANSAAKSHRRPNSSRPGSSNCNSRVGSAVGSTREPTNTSPRNPAPQQSGTTNPSVPIRSRVSSAPASRPTASLNSTSSSSAAKENAGTGGLAPSAPSGVKASKSGRGGMSSGRMIVSSTNNQNPADSSPRRAAEATSMQSPQAKVYSNIPADKAPSGLPLANEMTENDLNELNLFYHNYAIEKNKMKVLQSEAKAKAKTIEQSSERILEHCIEFRDQTRVQHNHIMYLLNHKEFLYPYEMKAKMDVFCSQGDNGTMDNCQRDLNVMESVARQNLYDVSMENMAKCAWLMNIVTKLKALHKKNRPNFPPCILRFLSVLKHVTMFGWPVDKELFYSVLEKTITVPDEEHCMAVVHRILKPVREAIHISPEAFLAYLDSQNVAAAPELMGQVRDLKQRKIRRSKLVMEHGGSGSRSGEENEEDGAYAAANEEDLLGNVAAMSFEDDHPEHELTAVS